MIQRLFPIWREFEEQALKSAPIEQKVEMQKAFYFGAAALLIIVKTMPEDISEEEGAQIFEELNQECERYLNSVKEHYERNPPRGFGR